MTAMMNATEDGSEPMGEAPELSTHSEPRELVQQAIPLNIDGARRAVWVPAQTTQCPHLVITPAVGSSDGRLRFRGTLALTHTHTGALLVKSTYTTGLEKLAAALKDFDWNFHARNHFADPANTDVVAAIRTVIQDWQLSQGYSGPVSLLGDDDEKKAAREAEPATTLLREQLDWWPAQHKSVHERDLINKNRDAWYEAISCSVNGYGMTYLLAVLQRVAPAVADSAARHLVAAFDAGDSLGEWIFQWSQELDSGQPLTLDGIPDGDPLAQFGSTGVSTGHVAKAG